MQSKIKKLFEEAKVDSVLLRTYPNAADPAFFHFSGLAPGFVDNNALIISPKKKPLLLRTEIDPEIKQQGIRTRTVQKRAQMEKIFHSELFGKRIGVNFSVLPASSLKKLKKLLPKKRFVDISQQLFNARAVKEKWEIARIAKAAKITENVLNQLPSFFKKGMTEYELALKIEFLLREKSNDNIAFKPIVASGRGSSFAHHVPSQTKIKNGLLLIDCGARFKGYCGDLTRVFSVGKPSSKEEELYRIVFSAKELAEALCTQGTGAGEIFKQSNLFLKRNAGKGLIHAMGHGLGIEVHDAPQGLREESEDVLEKNNVLTVEPGIYLKSFGIRIEDDVVVGKGKCRKLSNAPETLVKL